MHRLPLPRLALLPLEVFHMMNSKEKEKQRLQLSGLAERKMLRQSRTRKEQDRWTIKRDREMPEIMK